jgi:hypothetical protein
MHACMSSLYQGEETYTIQGYEGPETLLRQFSMSEREIMQLNPHLGREKPAGTVVCVKGRYEETRKQVSITLLDSQTFS